MNWTDPNIFGGLMALVCLANIAFALVTRRVRFGFVFTLSEAPVRYWLSVGVFTVVAAIGAVLLLFGN